MSHKYTPEQVEQQAGEAVIDAKYDNVLVPFARLMAKELHANAGKGDRPGWLSMTPAVGMLEIYYHAAKLQKAVKDDNGEGIREYAADVANMAMMLLDLCGGLAVADTALRQAPAQGEVTEAMELSVARALCRYSAICDDTDAEDAWKHSADDFKEQARVALEAVQAALSAQQQGEAVVLLEVTKEIHATPLIGAARLPHGDYKLYTAPLAQERVPEGWRAAVERLLTAYDEGASAFEAAAAAEQVRQLLAASPAPSPARGDGGEG